VTIFDEYYAKILIVNLMVVDENALNLSSNHISMIAA
jgi:hypothetical protein